MRPLIALSGSLAQRPGAAGHTWVFLQYLLGFRRLGWDVLFVLEENDLRRAPDLKHYQLAQQLRRTLITMDRDYLDDRRFPLDACGGVLVIHAPDERQLSSLLDRVDRMLFHADDSDERVLLPLAGRKLQVNTDWGRGDG